ncbi:endolytic transglycosylase MltG [Desulfoscipio sp. XC116]|uniref:endolytic transglycosylase MltG n=1 Tax=Desulfoscipio sp. XC116 TaxID=3144975 RepID=UPI00325A708C
MSYKYFKYWTGKRDRRRRYVFVCRPGTVLVAVIFLLLVGGLVMRASLMPVNVKNAADITVAVPQNASTSQIAALLAEKGVIRSAGAFRLYARVQGLDGAMKPGTYQLSTAMPVSGIIEVLLKGPPDRIKITIPEGYTVAQIAGLLQKQGIAGRDVFMQALDRSWQLAFLQEVPVSQWGLEGYLYPDTYFLGSQTGAGEIAEMMLKRFSQVIEEHDYIRQVEARGLTLHEAVTIASMVEREARVDSERPRIAGVIFNRLELGMPLQIDATVQYALGETKEKLLTKDLQVDSPYNTYRVNGLPPGPIANPGWPSMLAVIQPENHNYLYYVAKPDGSHAFSSSLAAHNANIRKYQ